MSAPVLMVLGTASSVGKSAIAAGLCRLLARRGLRVAPFKAQNMSLNAAVTADGGEIGRSTAVQAAAAGVEPTVDMNPILLKPESDQRAQLIVRGRVVGTLTAREYFGGKMDLWPVVAAALDRLRAGCDVVVAEGAGSPVEMNLRARDIANMRVARHAEAAVLLVGDIDRGGVFAQLVGTLDLLPPEERRLVRGLIVNRLRGDAALFADGVRFLEGRTALPVLGVVPWIDDLGLAEEDGAVLDEGRPPRGGPGALRIAVARYPGIANFDDFGPLEATPGVAVVYADRPARLDGADLIVLPGSKSTVADLGWLRERGLAEAVLARHAAGTPLLGVCGGYQMLGQAIEDPAGVESAVRRAAGLGRLPHWTVFAPTKRAARVRAEVVASRGPLAAAAGAVVDGYEIHMGRDGGAPAAEPLMRVVARAGVPVDEPDGVVAAGGLLLGTYLHGLFESRAVREALIDWLWGRRGDAGRLSASGGPVDPYDRWADALERALDLPLLLERCGIRAPA